MPRLYNAKLRPIPKEAVRIDRHTPFGNPFVIGTDGTRDDVCDKFENWIRRQPKLIKKIKAELKGKDLICWCHPLRCHGSTILRIANDE